MKLNQPDAAKPSSTIHQIKISLREIKPLIWRRILVSSQIRLSDLHEVFQHTMPWLGYHMHQFKIGEVNYGQPSDDDDDYGYEVLNEKDFVLEEIAPKEKANFLYEYDFGDDWFHEVRVEKIIPIDESQTYPICIDGARAVPPEDCGGPFGYDELQNTLSDSSNSEYDEMKTWAESLLGHPFDPEYFELNRINQNLRKRFRIQKSKRSTKQKSSQAKLLTQD